MAIVEVKCPQLSESVAEATLLQWKKRPGERVEMDEILVEIETDKVVLEVPAPAAGVMAQLVKNDGESCVADEVIAKIDTEGTEAVSPLDVKPVPDAVPAPGATPGVIPPPTPDAATNAAPAMPAAAKIMADNRIPAGSVPGTGKDGRVTKGDVLASM
jgi:2-oxoglutarate dehydrogenase E2 component (dihydrolipoamide succinyltransferase)